MGILNKVDVITDIGFAFGLAIGVVFNLNNRALDVPLKSEGVALLRQMDLVAWSLCSILVVSRIADFVCKYSPSSIAGLDVMMDPAHVRGILYRLGWIPADFVFLQFILLMTRTSVATHQQMLEVKDAMPCEAAEFSERVHRPCAKWLEECTLQLSTWGVPLALLIPEIIERGFMLYGILNFHSGEEEYMRLATLLESFRQTCNVLFSVFGVVLGPIQVSSTRRELRNALSEERRRDATLHTQIQAVETMVDSQNDGKGFGIPVFRLFVLNGAFLQTMCIRVALVGTAVKAFLDSEMGFAKVSQETSQEMLHNFTKNVTQFQETSQEMLRNFTKNVTKVHKDSWWYPVMQAWHWAGPHSSGRFVASGATFDTIALRRENGLCVRSCRDVLAIREHWSLVLSWSILSQHMSVSTTSWQLFSKNACWEEKWDFFLSKQRSSFTRCQVMHQRSPKPTRWGHWFFSNAFGMLREMSLKQCNSEVRQVKDHRRVRSRNGRSVCGCSSQ